MGVFRVASHHQYHIGESPRWDAETNTLWFVDIYGEGIFQYDPAADEVTQAASGKAVGGLAFNRPGGLVCGTGEGVALWSKQDGFTLIATEHAGERLACNDSMADPAGRFIFGTTFYGEAGRQSPRGKLYVMDRDRTVRVLDEGILHSNGLGFSPDGKTLYYTDSAERVIYAYDYDVASGTVAGRRVFVQVPDYEGIPDGMTVDAQGCVWSAQWYGGCVVRYTPQGAVDFVLRAPVAQTSAVAFGGVELDEIYVTSALRWAYLECEPKHFIHDSMVPGGELFCYRLGYKGMPTLYADIV